VVVVAVAVAVDLAVLENVLLLLEVILLLVNMYVALTVCSPWIAGANQGWSSRGTIHHNLAPLSSKIPMTQASSVQTFLLLLEVILLLVEMYVAFTVCSPWIAGANQGWSSLGTIHHNLAPLSSKIPMTQASSVQPFLLLLEVILLLVEMYVAFTVCSPWIAGANQGW